MLPIIKEENLNDKSKIKRTKQSAFTNRSILCQSHLSSQNYEQKFLEEAQLNEKLKNKYETIKIQATTNPKPRTQRDGFQMKEKQIFMQEKHLQQKIRILDNLISENSKMKKQVNNQRNQRVIYFNIYKNLQHEIHQWEEKYKNLLIEKRIHETAIQKIKQKFEFAKIRLVKEQKHVSREKIEKPIEYSMTMIDEDDIKVSKRSKLVKHSTQIQQNDERQRRNLIDLEFELEQKKTFFSNLEKRIKFTTETENLTESIEKMREIQSSNQKLFDEIKNEEKIQKKVKKKTLYNKKVIGQFSSGIVSEDSRAKTIFLKKSQEKLCKQLYELEKQNNDYTQTLSKLIDFDVKNLSGEEALRHSMRRKHKSKTDRKKLDKMLEETGKQKNQHNQLLKPEQLRLQILKKGFQ